MKAPTFLQWWTSHETDDRTRMIRHADGDREAMFDLVRKAFYAGRQTAQLAAPEGKPIECRNHPDEHRDLTVGETHFTCIDCGDSWANK